MNLTKVFAVIKTCPTCQKDLQFRPATSILECPDQYHGKFVVEETTKGNYFITYEPSKRSVA